MISLERRKLCFKQKVCYASQAKASLKGLFVQKSKRLTAPVTDRDETQGEYPRLLLNW